MLRDGASLLAVGFARPESLPMPKNSLLAAAFATAFVMPALAWAQTAAPAGDAAAGAKKNQMCTGCHGIVGAGVRGQQIKRAVPLRVAMAGKRENH